MTSSESRANARQPGRGRPPGARTAALLLLMTCAACAGALHPVDELPRVEGPARSADEVRSLLEDAEADYRARTPEAVERALESWREAASADPDGTEGLVGLVQGQIWLGSHLGDAAEREARAVEAVKAGQLCLEREPDSVECRYWLAIAIGLQARERRSTGLDAVKRMERMLTAVAELDPDLDRAGPDRVLALLYLRAPGWPAGPGDPDLGLEHALKAVERRPDHPPNRLCLAEAQIAVGNTADGRRSYEGAVEAARAALARSEPDAAEWLEEAERGAGRGEGR